MITYTTDISTLKPEELSGFFVGWPNPPTTERFKQLLRGSYKVIVAMDKDKVVAFITAISDGVLSAYIPFLEVLPEYQSLGIGAELVKQMKQELSQLYMIDLLCDEELIPYYEKQGMSRASGACMRNYARQSGS